MFFIYIRNVNYALRILFGVIASWILSGHVSAYAASNRLVHGELPLHYSVIAEAEFVCSAGIPGAAMDHRESVVKSSKNTPQRIDFKSTAAVLGSFLDGEPFLFSRNSAGIISALINKPIYIFLRVLRI